MIDRYYVVTERTSPYAGHAAIELEYLERGGIVRLLVLNGRATIITAALGDVRRLPAPAPTVHIVLEDDRRVTFHVEGRDVGRAWYEASGDEWRFTAQQYEWWESYGSREALIDAIAPLFGHQRIIRFGYSHAVEWLTSKTAVFRLGQVRGTLSAYGLFLHCLAVSSEYDAVKFAEALQRGQRVFEWAGEGTLEVTDVRGE